MLSTPLLQLAEKNGWKTDPSKESVFGPYSDYYFTAFDGKGFKAFVTSLAGIRLNDLDLLRDYLDRQARALNLRNYEISDNFLCVRRKDGLFPVSTEKLEYLLGQISGLLAQFGLPPNCCVICGRPAARRGLYMGFCAHLHPECEQQEMIDFTDPESFAEKPEPVVLPGEETQA